jgi:hypothetical protein
MPGPSGSSSFLYRALLDMPCVFELLNLIIRPSDLQRPPLTVVLKAYSEQLIAKKGKH